MHKDYEVRYEVTVKDKKGEHIEVRVAHMSARNQENAERRVAKRFPDCKVLVQEE